MSPEVFKERSALLDDLVYAEGRQPNDIKRTMFLSLICWRDQNELERRMGLLRGNIPQFANMSTQELLEFLRANMAGILGTPDDVCEQLSKYASAGVEELIVSWFGTDDTEGLEVIAEQVLPHFST